jgi:hypothetical protein
MKRLAKDMVTPFWQSKPPIYLGRARRESLHAQARHRAADGLASGHRDNLLERYDYPFLNFPKGSLSGLTPVQALRRGLVTRVMTAARGHLER